MANDIKDLLEKAFQCHGKGDILQAERYYNAVLTREANNAAALHYLGVVRHQQGQNTESETLIRRALGITPNDFMAMSNLATTLSALGKNAEAEKLYSVVLKAQPNNIEVLQNRANAYQSSGNFEKAIEDYRQVLRLNPQVFEAARNLGHCLGHTGQNFAAEKALMMCVSLAPRYPQGYVSLANFYRTAGMLEFAKAHYENALALVPHIAEIRCDYAGVLRDLGDLQNAKSHFEKSLEINSLHGKAWFGLSALKKYENPSELVSLQEALEKTSDKSAEIYMNFALGKAHEDIEAFDQAFTYYHAANSLQACGGGYKSEQDLAFFESLKSVFGSDFRDKFAWKGNGTKRPIFVLGMPRSGTSLVEQILASHSTVYGAGELSILAAAINHELAPKDDLDYTASLAAADTESFHNIAANYLKSAAPLTDAEAKHFVDKMPMNFLHLGIIALSMPNATIIHCQRDPIDNCLSIYKNHLPAIGHGYAANLSTLGQYHKAYQDLMAHWEHLFEGRIYTANYEALVENPEDEIKALLAACDLDFEPACLTPHKTKHSVSTLSAAQVRQPINQRSVGKWRKFETHLDPLVKALNKKPGQ